MALRRTALPPSDMVFAYGLRLWPSLLMVFARIADPKPPSVVRGRAHLGDVIAADQDGVARSDAREVATLGEPRRANEESARRGLGNGELGLDLYPLTGCAPSSEKRA